MEGSRCLSLAGRATLIQAVVAAIPSYTMQTVGVSRLVCDELDRKIRRFLWGGSETEWKVHLVAWRLESGDCGKGGWWTGPSKHTES